MATLVGRDQPEALALRAAIAGNPEAIGRQHGVIAKAVTPAEFFAPDNVDRPMRGVARPRQT